MDRKEAIDTIYNEIKSTDAVISSTGLISREIYKNYDGENNFYMVGSMGLASSIALGVAVNNRDKNVVVIEGDASLLMNMGSLATIGHVKPENFTHVVLDNQAYASCSEEPSVSGSIDLAAVARASGYTHTVNISNEHEFTEALKLRSEHKGPLFILAKINLGGQRDLPRPLDLPLIAERFKLFLNNNSLHIDKSDSSKELVILEESQSEKLLVERFKQILRRISKINIEKFKGIGIVLYNSNLLSHTVHTNTHSENPIQDKLNIFDEECIDTLLDLARWDSPYHDGFIFIDEHGKVTDIAQYFVPPIVPNKRPKEGMGIRYNSAFYGSFISGVIATGMVSSKKEPFLFQNGEKLLLSY